MKSVVASLPLIVGIVTAIVGWYVLSSPSNFDPQTAPTTTPAYLEPLPTGRSLASIPVSFTILELESLKPLDVAPSTLRTLGVSISSVTIPISVPISKIDLTIPQDSTRPLEPLSTSLSSIIAPILVPFTTIEQSLESRLPAQITASGRFDTGSWIVGRLSYRATIKRSNVALSKHSDNAIAISSNVSATGSVAGVSFRASARLNIYLRPELGENWRIKPNMDYHLSDFSAHVRVFGIRISVRSLVRSRVDSFLSDIRNSIEKNIRDHPFLEQQARLVWSSLCGNLPLSSGPDVWLKIDPVRIISANLTIREDAISTKLGLIFEARVIDNVTAPVCPFPNLRVEEPGDGRLEFVFSAEIMYDTLDLVLQDQLGGNVYTADNYSIRFDSVRVRPYGSSILLSADVVAWAPKWLANPVRGTIYVVAEPRLDVANQKIELVNLGLDTSSKNALAKFGFEIIESVVTRSLGRVVFDLKPEIEHLENVGRKSFEEFSGARGIAIDTIGPDIQLERLEVGRDKIRLVATAVGTVSISVETIEW